MKTLRINLLAAMAFVSVAASAQTTVKDAWVRGVGMSVLLVVLGTESLR